jgi:hypothetical protein
MSASAIRTLTLALALAVTGGATLPSVAVADQPSRSVHHRTVKVDGLDIFYREAGPKDAPAILLLHGFPTSSRMFRNLMPELADRYHLVAADYPGYGHSSAPSVQEFDYTFDHLARRPGADGPPRQ